MTAQPHTPVDTPSASAQHALRRVRRAPRRALERLPPPYRELDRVFEVYGGIVSTRELRMELGDWPEMIPVLRGYGQVIPLRQGCYGAPWLPADAELAWRFGGRLACISALEFSGLREKPLDTPWGLGAVRPLHICVPSSTPRITESWKLVPRGWQHTAAAPIVHWSTHDARSGDRRAVSMKVARRQAEHCREGKPD